VAAMAMYLASEELLEMVCCFFDFQEIRDFPIYMGKPVTIFFCLTAGGLIRVIVRFSLDRVLVRKKDTVNKSILEIS